MWHSLFITAHAVTGTVALLAGCVAIARRTLFGTYFGSLVAMEVFLLLALTAGWAETDVLGRVLFSALALLGVVMVWRANQARRGPFGASYVEHVGFTLVALFDAFAVVLVLNRGAPPWLVVGSGILIAVAGHFAITAVHHRLGTRPTPSSTTTR